jgi:hypothetical protein
MKYKFDVLVILNDESSKVALPVIRNQLAHADHIGKVFIGNTSRDTLQEIASDMEQQAQGAVKYTKSPSASSRRVIHGVHVERPVILGLRDAEFNVLMDSSNPVVVIGTPEELGESKTRELITRMQRPDRPVVEFLYTKYIAPSSNAANSMDVTYINLLFILEYLATLQVTIHDKQKAKLTMYKYMHELGPTGLANVTRLDTNLAKSPNYRAINRAFDAVTIGIKENRQKHNTITPVTQVYNMSTPFVKDVGVFVDNIVIVPQQLLTKLEATKWYVLSKPRLFIIVITPENARQVTDLMVDNPRVPTKTVGGRISRFFTDAAGAVFGTESSRRRRRTQKQLQSKLRRTLKAGPLHTVTQDMKNLFQRDLKAAKSANKVTKQKYMALIEARGARAALSDASNTLKTINTAASAGVALPPAELRKLEIARTLTQNVDKYIKEAQDEHAAKVKEFNAALGQALAKLDTELTAAQKSTNLATQELHAHQTAHGTNNALTRREVDLRLEAIATESEDAIDAMLKSLINGTNDSINGILEKFNVQSIRNTSGMSDRQQFNKEAQALALEATAKVNSILHDKYNAKHTKNAVKEFHNTLRKFNEQLESTKTRITEINADINKIDNVLSQKVKTNLFGVKYNGQVAEHVQLAADKVALVNDLAFETYKQTMYKHITDAFLVLTNVIMEVNAKLADRLAGLPERQSRLEELNQELQAVLAILVERKGKEDAHNHAIRQKASAQLRLARLTAGNLSESPSLAMYKKAANNAKAMTPELTPVDKQTFMHNNLTRLAGNISKVENKLGSLSRKRRAAKWYQIGEKRTLKQQQAAKRAELSSLKRRQASIRRRQKEQVL